MTGRGIPVGGAGPAAAATGGDTARKPGAMGGVPMPVCGTGTAAELAAEMGIEPAVATEPFGATDAW